ncbi:MAG: hypothetical protein C0489_12790 [Candidatus Accumulibacter sp.]|nr:hypothetical protein [Accumulibacter sp.]
MVRHPLALGLFGMVAGCGGAPYDPRGVQREETLLSVSATGQAETRPDEAQFQAGINSWDGNAKAAGEANLAKIREIVGALRQLGVAEKDIQTRTVSVQRVDWGDRKGQYQASNIVNVTVRDVDKAGAAVAAVTGAGANIVSGPDLRMARPEKAATSAYTSAYKAARARAQAYADAAGMKISRVLTIRDSGGVQGNRPLPAAAPVPPPPVVMEQASADASAGFMPGQTTSAVAVQVDFALVAK